MAGHLLVPSRPPTKNQAKTASPKRHPKITKYHPRTPRGPILGPFWEPCGLSFWTFFMTISATTRFSKICTAPTREHDFRGSSLPKITHFGTLFPLNFRTFSRPPSGTPFWSLLYRLGPQTPLWIPLAPKMAPKLKSTKNPCTKIHNAARSPPTLFTHSVGGSVSVSTFLIMSSLP